MVPMSAIDDATVATSLVHRYVLLPVDLPGESIRDMTRIPSFDSTEKHGVRMLLSSWCGLETP
jgi:hypothetical protein